MTHTRSRLLASSVLASAALLAAAPAFAQSTEPTTGNVKTTTTETQGQGAPSTREVPNAGGVNAPGDTGTQVGEVVVTGSRISRRDYVADSPVVSVGPKAVENTGAVTLDKLFNEIPQFVPGLGTSNNNPGNNGQVNIQLRGLGFNRNLVLLDGRRITPSNTDGTVDINNVPQALIENIEVVSGGQSTSYGSDAIAGVVNFKLKHNFEGVVVDASYGTTEKGDGQTQGVNFTAGSNFASQPRRPSVASSPDTDIPVPPLSETLIPLVSTMTAPCSMARPTTEAPHRWIFPRYRAVVSYRTAAAITLER